MVHSTPRLCCLVFTVFFLTVPGADPSAADEGFFERLRNNPTPHQSERTSDSPSRKVDAGDTDPPSEKLLPPLRLDPFPVDLRYRSGESLPVEPPLRLIAPPVGETDVDTRSTEHETGPVKPSTRADTAGSDTGPRIGGAHGEPSANLTAPYNHRFFVGVRWPGVSVGFHEPPYSLELKYLEDSPEVKIIGLRLYHHVLPLEVTNYYWGVDLARFDFQGEVSEGDGTSTGVFLGFQRDVASHVSWSLDVGPYYIYLKDDSTRLSASGLEFTVTTGLNLELW